MTVRKLTTRSLALAVAVSVVAAPLAAQQDTTKLRRTTTSEKRINVSKGEVELPPRVDTVIVTRADTVRETYTRVDTVTVTQPAPIITKVLSDWYWGLFAGGTGPVSDIDRIQTNGYNAGLVGGWENRPGWFGARLTGSYTQIGREQGLSPLLVGTGLPQMWQFTGDLKLKGNVGGWSPYILGGLGFNSYKRMATVSDFPNVDLNPVVNPLDFTPTIDDLNNRSADDFTVCAAKDNVDLNDVGTGDNLNCYRLATNNWRTAFSWNFGFGTDFHIGSQDMFFEWRWNPISTHGAYTWYMPISLGLRYF